MLKPIAGSIFIAYNEQAMKASYQINGKTIEIVRVRLGDGWMGKVVTGQVGARTFSKAGWLKTLSRPAQLLDDVEELLKTEDKKWKKKY